MVYIDDSIMQKGHIASAGSKILENFAAPFDATVVTRLADDTARIKLAEFGMGDPGELPDAPLLCNDVFGHVRTRAAAQGLCYIRPAYGTVSRYGLIPTASSMDQIGVACKNPFEGYCLLSAIAGHDENDGAMFPEKRYTYTKAANKPRQIDARQTYKTLPYADLFGHVMTILTCAELCNNISRYDGIKFGYRAPGFRGLDELYVKTRTEALGGEARFAAIMGCIVLSHGYYGSVYDKAMRIRRLIKESLPFDEYDILALAPDNPLPQLAGLPSLTFSNMQLVSNVGNEGALLAGWEVAQ